MLAVIPAGGEAVRFGGIYKEMLPIGQDQYLLQQAFRRAQEMGANSFLLITSEEKVSAHMRFIRTHIADLHIMVMVRRQDERDLWSGIRSALYFDDDCLLVLPDTTFDLLAQPDFSTHNIVFCAFSTDTPERFSCIDLHARSIITKQAQYDGHRSLAWGCVYWSRTVSRFWLAGEGPMRYTTYDEAFQDAMRAFTPGVFPIWNYQDLGTWSAYQDYITGKKI